MAFQTGTATSPNNLLDILRGFLVSNGWTQEAYSQTTFYGGQQGFLLRIHKSGKRLNFASSEGARMFQHVISTAPERYINGIAMYESTGFDPQFGWDKQPGGYNVDDDSYGSCIHPLTNILNYYLYSDVGGDSFHLTVEYEAGKFTHLTFGNTPAETVIPSTMSYISSTVSAYAANNFATYGSVLFAFLTSSSQLDRTSTVIRYNNTFYDYTNARFNYDITVGVSPVGDLWEKIDNQPNAYNGRRSLEPLDCNAFANGILNKIGSPDFIRAVSCQGIESFPFSESIGSDNWDVYPLHTLTDSSGNRGIAVRKIV